MKVVNGVNEHRRSQVQIALITGTSSGFGLLTAIELARLGYVVVATMRDLSKSEELRKRAEADGVADRLVYKELDVTVPAAIERVFAELQHSYGRLDVLVNNAGYAVGGFVEEIPMEDWRQQMETNFFGLVAVSKAALPIMREQQSGMIFNIGSVSGRIGFPGYAPYAASKFAVEGFSESLRHELAPFGVRVILIEPGAYRTPIWGKGMAHIRSRPGSPYESMLQAVLRYSRRAADTAPDPQQVAQRIGRLVNHRSPGLRYPLGQGSRIGLWGKALLPWRWYEGLVSRMLKRD